MAANDEFYSGHETFGDNKEESDEEEEDLLDLVASGQLSKLKKLAKEVEESAGRPQLATPKLKSDKGQNKTAKTSVAKTSSDSPSDVQQTSGKEATESQQVTEKKDKKKKKDEKKKDEKNKDEKNTFMSKEEKHALANEKRLESLKLRQKAHLSHKKLIQSALQSVDQPESSKKIVFDSDSEDDVGQSSSMMDTVGMEPEKSNLKKKEEDSESDSEESSSQEEQLKAKSSSQMAGLFESESESGDEDEDEDIFRIRPEKEGKTGRKLMALQNRLGGDTRFKMDESFLEEEEEKEEEKKEEKDMEVDEEGKDEGEGVTETEKQKSMAILAGIVGSKVARREKRQTYRDMTSIQYDPAKPGHERLEVTREPKPKKQKVTKEEVTPTQKNLEPELPEVSKDRYFSVTSSLKDVFAKDTGFSFNFSVDNQESSSLQAANESAASEKIETKNQMMNPWSQKQFSYESSDDEDAGDKVEDKSSGVSTDKEKDTNKTKSKGWGWSKDSFFFSESDPRIKESLEFFGQKEDQEKIREEWAEERPVLIEAYRLKRKRALRKHNEASKARLWLNNKASRRKNFHPAKRARKI